jgi:hypothetical protein
MTTLHLVGTVLWGFVLLLVGALALSGYGWASVALAVCLAVFVVLLIWTQRLGSHASRR